MPAVNAVGKPCAGEPHARIDGRELETERTGQGYGEERSGGKPLGINGFVTYRQETPPRQLSTLRQDPGVEHRRNKHELHGRHAATSRASGRWPGSPW